MPPRRSRSCPTLWIALFVPLLSTGPCVDVLQTSILNGFFNAVNPRIVEQARQGLGLRGNLADPNDLDAQSG